MIDPDVAAWILDFLLRQTLDDSLVHRLILSLPIPAPSPSSPLHRTLILRRLSSDLSRRSLSPRTLHSLELLSSLPRPSSAAALRAAYAAVAADLTVKPLRPSSRGGDDDGGGGGGGEGGGEGEFYDAVNRIWNCRVADLEAAAEGAEGAEAAAGLVSPELRATRREMEEAVVDATVRAGLVVRYTEERAFQAVRVYLEEAWKELGPSFLELAAEALIGMAKGKGLEMENPNSSKPSPEEGSRLLELVNHSGTVNKRGKEIIEENTHEGESSSPELHDPSSVGWNRMGKCKSTNFRSFENANESGNRCTKTILKLDRDSAAERRPSMMERNPTARTIEWDDLFGSPLPANPVEEPHVSYPQKGKDSLLVKDNNQFILRKRRKKWSSLEEETLRKSVERHGVGNWKFIKQCHPSIFKDRTEVDLKDKWRNLVRH
ncbi:telomeric repeat-binding factor 2-like isoform X2 [Ananas comosus]|uniref:Telomeric repeat-binding factor 2-like isoform X2 n=1 Tax=Ananas comosus TaxID=4615 RepID=A0A6P5FC92_ANACO|nr:telomeric repeat-binding factor 2-like isoform X2 [Ananas comosus]